MTYSITSNTILKENYYDNALQMEDQISTLEMYFKKHEVQCDDDDLNANEDVIEGEYWEFKEPERVEAWSLFMIPFTYDMTLSYKFKSA